MRQFVDIRCLHDIFCLQGFKMLLVTVRAIKNAESVRLLLTHGADPAVLTIGYTSCTIVCNLQLFFKFAIYIAEV